MFHISGAMDRAIAALPIERHQAAKDFISDIQLGVGLFEPLPTKLLVDADKLSKIVSGMIRADLLQKGLDPSGSEFDRARFIASADAHSEKLAAKFHQVFPKKYDKDVTRLAESTALGFVGLHGVLVWPRTLAAAISEDKHGAKPFKEATEAFRADILVPMARQLGES